VALRSCTVSLRDSQEVEHSVDVSAETLYEVIAATLAPRRSARCSVWMIKTMIKGPLAHTVFVVWQIGKLSRQFLPLAHPKTF